MFSLKKRKKKEQKSDEKPEKQIIKRLEEEIEFLRKFHSDSEIEDEDDQVKVFVAQRDAKGHLQNLGHFSIPSNNIQFLQEWVKEVYGQGRYCIHLEKGSFRSKGADIWIATGFRRESPQPSRRPSPPRGRKKTWAEEFEERQKYFERIAATMLKVGVKPEDFYKQQQQWWEEYIKARYGQEQKQKDDNESKS